MDKLKPHFLLAYDGKSASKRAISYLKQALSPMPFDVTLCHIIDYPGFYYIEPDLLKALQREKKIQTEIRRLVRIVQDELKKCAENFKENPEVNVFIKYAFKKKSVAEDLISIANENFSDSIIIGRRGLTKLSSYILGGITYELLEKSSVPLWFIRGNKWNKRFLVCFKIDEKDLAIFDYISFLLRNHPLAEIKFFHTSFLTKKLLNIPSFEGKLDDLLKKLKNHDIVVFFEKVKKIFEENGFPLKKGMFLLKHNVLGTVGDIVRIAKKGDYSTIIVGYSEKKGLTGFINPTLSERLLSYFKDKAIWVIKLKKETD